MSGIITLRSITYASAITQNDSKQILEVLLTQKRSEHTRRAYSHDLRNFFSLIAPGRELTSDLAREFLSLSKTQAIAVVVAYRNHLFEQGLAPATINRRISAIKSLVEMGQIFDICNYDLEVIKNEKVRPYRDTKGIEVPEVIKLFEAIDTSSLGGKRDYSIMRLLWSNALRRGEIPSLDVKHFKYARCQIEVSGKGRNGERELVTISQKTAASISDWLQASNAADKPNEPIFISLDPVRFGNRLTGEAIRLIVIKYCKLAGIEKQMSPHRVRHSAITEALNQNNGNIRATQKLSRHSDPRTVIIYDDNRVDLQGVLTRQLDDLI
ncbi:tyrosine-type recombinase/integrase [Nostoc sphaeroides]|uniref:XerC, integrase/recombinase XerC n=1 Tax=Nostoc sphaeroides CCNUC1 TaxID=2653204 RepID=A0A5P8WJL1_9NOSO|nr:tyrosine-type recombinase/integrase [Nostoc sphaeroides]QFS52761.1 xerC, integrase/recombinase XerC [Nostoc sphaeroides CCNUC1]